MVLDHIYNRCYMRGSTDSESPMRTNWFHILLCLADGEQHGYGIMQEVLERTAGKMRLWPATLYGTLKRLMEEGLIEEAEEDDARRICYRLTKLGRQVLSAESVRLRELVRLLEAKGAI